MKTAKELIYVNEMIDLAFWLLQTILLMTVWMMKQGLWCSVLKCEGKM